MKTSTAIPLFDRLVDDDVDVISEPIPYRFMNEQDCYDFIRQDLERLLNTRVAMIWRPNTHNSNVPFSYGVNATCTVSAENIFEIQELEKRIDDVIALFEPRLINAKSHVLKTGIEPSTLFISIDAQLDIEGKQKFVTFPVVVDM